MRIVTLIFCAVLLAGCNALGGINDSTMNSVANAGGGCIKVTGVWGTGIIVVGNADKGVIRNGELTVAGDCGGITVRESASARGVPPVPGTVTTTIVPGSTTTTVVPTPPAR